MTLSIVKVNLPKLFRIISVFLCEFQSCLLISATDERLVFCDKAFVFQMVYRVAFTPALWRFGWCHRQLIWGFSSQLLKHFCHQLLSFFLGRPIQRLAVRSPVVSFFFRTLPIIVLTMPGACAMAPIDFRLYKIKYLAFLHTDIFMLFYPKGRQSSQAKLKRSKEE